MAWLEDPQAQKNLQAQAVQVYRIRFSRISFSRPQSESNRRVHAF